MGQPRPASPSEDHQDDERKLHLAENLWKALVFVFAELKAIARFIWRSPHHFDSFIHWLDTLDPSRALASWGFAPADVTLGRERRFQRAGISLPADEQPSEKFVDVHRDGRHAASTKRIGLLHIEILQAGGWTRANMGDAFSAEDVFAMVVSDGCVAVTSTKYDCVAPAWKHDERRAFRIPVNDGAATLSLACFNERKREDWPIGRCAVALRAFAPNTLYDCWLPLVLSDTAGEKLANSCRALVAKEPLARQAAAHQTQAESRGAIRVRFRVDWSDGGVAACRSALADVLYAPVRASVATPATASGQRVRENVRFTLFGEGGCPCDALNEPFATQRIRGHAREAVADVLNAVAAAHTAMLSLIRYERPLRSVLALVAWASCVQRPIRCLAWICVFSGLGLRDALLGDGRAPSVAKPPMTFGRWLKAVAGLQPQVDIRPIPVEQQFAWARGRARKVVADRTINEMKTHHEEIEEEEEEEKKKVEEAAKVAAEAIGPMKSFWSFNPLAPLLLPVQRVLLSIARRQRALKAVCNGRDDPVATATVAFAFFLTGLTVFVYTELIHPLVMWSLVQVEHLVVYALHLVGFLLYGPQNYVLSRLRRRLRHKRHVKIAMTWFEGPYRTAVRRVQRYWRARQMRKRAAYLLERIEQQKDAFEARKAYQAARKHLDDLEAAATMKRRLEERHDRAEVKALEAFQQRQSNGPVRAKRALDGCKCGKIPQLIRLEGERITFGATFDEKKAVMPLSIDAARIRSVPLYDVRRPRTVEFKVKSIYRVCGLRNHKKYKLVCDEARDAELLVGALRALTRPKLKASQSVRDLRMVERAAEVDEELLAPEKPFGFLAASVTEFGPARPEAFRSVVVASSAHVEVEEEW